MMREALRQDPESNLFLAWHAWTLFASNPDMNSAMALSHLQTALQGDPGLADAQVFRARISEFLGEYDDAARSYRSACRLAHTPPSFVLEARAFEKRLQEANERAEAAKSEVDVVDLLNEDVGRLLRRWMLNDR